jgi:hypothetical protein
MQRFNDSSGVAACLNYNLNTTDQNQLNHPFLQKFYSDAPKINNMNIKNVDKKQGFSKAPVRSGSIFNDNRCKCPSCLNKPVAPIQTQQTSPQTNKTSYPIKITSENSLTKFMYNIRNEKHVLKANQNYEPINNTVDSKKTRAMSNDDNTVIIQNPINQKDVSKSKPKNNLINRTEAKSQDKTAQNTKQGRVINALDSKNPRNQQGLNQNFSCYSLNTSSLFSYRNDPAYVEMIRNKRRGALEEESKYAYKTILEKKKSTTISIKSNKSCQTSDDFDSKVAATKLNAYIVSNSRKGDSNDDNKFIHHRSVCNHINIVCEKCARKLQEKHGNNMMIFSSC